MPTAQAVLILCAASLAFAAEGPGDALAIMRTVAANTTAATEGRRQYVYHQKVVARLVRGDGKTAGKETREYTVVPQETTTDKTLVSFSGEYRDGKRMVQYSQPGAKDKGDGGDREVVSKLVDELVNAKDTRDGIPHDLFPLSNADLAYYQFSLKGETNLLGRRTWDIMFEPANRKGLCIQAGPLFRLEADVSTGPADHAAVEDRSCHQWKGDAWIDAEEYQPVRIETKMAKGVPWGARIFGLNVRQLGFSIHYQRLAENVWFPATYGTEFDVVVFWGYKRTATLSMENTGFRKTDADSIIHFDPPQPSLKSKPEFEIKTGGASGQSDEAQSEMIFFATATYPSRSMGLVRKRSGTHPVN